MEQARPTKTPSGVEQTTATRETWNQRPARPTKTPSGVEQLSFAGQPAAAGGARPTKTPSGVEQALTARCVRETGQRDRRRRLRALSRTGSRPRTTSSTRET